MTSPAIKPDINRLIRRHGIISDQVEPRELTVILRELDRILAGGVSGAVTEFGCYSGTTSLYFRRMLDMYDDRREFHVYDSFVGLPEKTGHDASPAGEQFKAGELSVSKKEFMLNFKKAGLALPRIHKGWFSGITTADVPDSIAFAFLDGDYYDSIMDPLRLIWPRLSPGAIVIVDDYANEALPGAAKAVDDWLKLYPAPLRVEHSLAIIQC